MLAKRSPIALIISLLLVFLVTGVGLAGPGESPVADENLQAGADPIVRGATRHDTSPPLSSIPPAAPEAGALKQIPHPLPNRQDGPPDDDEVVQPFDPYPPAIPGPGQNFEGINNLNGVLPPDTDGDVGPNHYVQMVNLSFAIWDKSGNLLMGPLNSNTLWTGFGGPCESTNDGDPIVVYDHLADRWLLSQFALPNFPNGPFYECIAISQTPNPTGAYHRYEFLISVTKLNDYPKFGVWPDAYYMAVNQFNAGSLSWGGQGAVAFERDKMLLGQPAQMVYFDMFGVDPNLGGMLPSDLDGPVPPAGAPNTFVQMDDDSFGYSPDQLQLWEFDVNWTTPTSSTFTLDVALGTAAFDSNMCNYSRNCIRQPGGVAVDAISDRLMYRLQYRNFGTHQTLVTNHTVDVNGNNLAGVRWYELRKTGGGWSIFQQSSYSPDSDNRWMGSIAMDGNGNMALGYSVSSRMVFPSIRYTGRLSTDPLGMMTQGEGVIIAGSGYQQHSSGRWGDYSALVVDPVDDCTFWYTQEYYAVIGNAPWQTRVGSFTVDGCGGQPTATPTVTTTPTPTATGPTPTPTKTATPGGRKTATPTPTFTPTPTGPIPTNTPTPTSTPRRTPTPGPI